jgi:hypothetical protein
MPCGVRREAGDIIKRESKKWIAPVEKHGIIQGGDRYGFEYRRNRFLLWTWSSRERMKTREYDIQQYENIVYKEFAERLKKAFPEGDFRIYTFDFGIAREKMRSAA